MSARTNRRARMFATVMIIGCIAPAGALAGSLIEGSGPVMPSALRLIIAFAVVILLLFGLRAVLRRMSSPNRSATNKLMNVVEVLPVGPKAKLVTVRVGERLVVVGAADSSVTHITDISWEEYESFTSESHSNVVPFKERLLRLARK